MNLQNLIDLFAGFFLSNLLGYGGGPASIPLMYQEIVTHYRWTNDTKFSNLLALGNTLPGPIATKIAAFVGFDVAGIGGALVALVATVVPSAVLLIVLLRLMAKYRHSSVVKGMTLLVQPVIAVMMILLTWQMGRTSIEALGWWQAIPIAAIALWAMEKRKIHPALVILCAFVYGGLVVPHI
ncbi:transporter [Cohnella sp. CIP 111063]|uniref:chromate transporter n=1 Tax=unclassified Cohnella TaxID=2636738 RepID=UPI000B8BD7E8|nr:MULTISPECIES: chromate transporter [unclassified Cohnella]OXS59139.1 transporter [Cohnella sp. CIP 111063]PRX72144.1 chromate transporter [Cohnella sp. SGD-V74]